MNTTDSRILTPLASSNLPTVYGPFRIIAFDSGIEHLPHIVLENLNGENSIANVRIHSECMTGDVFGSLKCDCGEQLKASLTYIEEHGGLLIYLRQEGRNIGLVNKLKAYHLQDQGMDTIQSNHALGFHTDQRTYEDALAILHYYKLTAINLLTNNPDKLQAFENSGIEVKNRIPVVIPSNPQNDGYLSVKKNTLGHLL
jgi:GTP cyclohydrolase II